MPAVLPFAQCRCLIDKRFEIQARGRLIREVAYDSHDAGLVKCDLCCIKLRPFKMVPVKGLQAFCHTGLTAWMHEHEIMQFRYGIGVPGLPGYSVLQGVIPRRFQQFLGVRNEIAVGVGTDKLVQCLLVGGHAFQAPGDQCQEQSQLGRKGGFAQRDAVAGNAPCVDIVACLVMGVGFTV